MKPRDEPPPFLRSRKTRGAPTLTMANALVGENLAILEGGATRQQTYVAMTRGREANHAFVPDQADTLDPADRLADILSQTLDRESALATIERLHSAVELPDPEHLLEVPGPGLEIDFFGR